MIESLPYYYRKSKVVNDLYAVIQDALNMVSVDISKEDLKLFITETDDFTLHEKDVGLAEIIADIETKRSRVIARIQGNNLLTKAELKKLIAIYNSMDCTITEDFANYTVTISFYGRMGKPYNFEQITKAVDEVKPAHIKIEYEYEKNTWGEIRSKLGTWGNAKSFTWGLIGDYDGRTWLYVKTQYETIKNMWIEINTKIKSWNRAKKYTWKNAKIGLQLNDDIVYLQENNANAYVILINDVPYAHFI